MKNEEMMRSILLGNGINARLKIEQLYTDKIFDRFVFDAKRYVPLLKSVFSNRITVKQIDDLFDKNNKNIGIETQARKLYDYIKNVAQPERDWWASNDEHRLQDIITCIAITSIFYNDQGLIKPLIDKTLLPNLSNYENIFTLNYYEFWDDNKKCIPLHGYFDYKQLVDVPNAFIHNPLRMNLQAYCEGIEKMKLKGNAVSFGPREYIFAPEGINKKNLKCITGILCDGSWHPDEDCYLIEKRDLYKELNGVMELDIFGVSPYGDSDLINIIDEMKNVRVFIHEKVINPETEAWENKLKKCSYVLEDALSI